MGILNIGFTIISDETLVFDWTWLDLTGLGKKWVELLGVKWSLSSHGKIVFSSCFWMIPMQSDCVPSNHHNIFDQYHKITKNPLEMKEDLIWFSTTT